MDRNRGHAPGNEARALGLLIGACMVILGLSTATRAQEARPVIADYTVAKEAVLRSIPEQYIRAAKERLHIMYCGTSHSSQVVDGLRGLMEYKPGDAELYKVSFDGRAQPKELDIDYRPNHPVKVYSEARDLSHDSMDAEGHTQYYRKTIEYLDHPDHAHVNVVMWSWCSIEGHDVQRYLDDFGELAALYRPGGAKGRTRANAVVFVFMTGYARGDDADTPEPPYIKSPFQNRQRIVDYCRRRGHLCLDYWSQDCYDYGTDAYHPDVNGNSNRIHLAYQQAHEQGQDWFVNRNFRSGEPKLPAHANNHITGNRRAYAAWWIWARLAGWSGRGAE